MNEEPAAPVKDKAYWESKHPEVIQMYRGRPLPDGTKYEMDVRHFIWCFDGTLESIINADGLADADICKAVLNVQRFVVSHVAYVSDTNLGASEYFLYPTETITMMQGDCEDGAILIASMLLCILPPAEHWRIRVAAGTVQANPTAPQGGHAYVTFCRPQDNEWVVVDWCYFEDSSVPVKDKVLLKDNTPYKQTWFSWNHLHAWSHQTFDLNGRLPKNV